MVVCGSNFKTSVSPRHVARLQRFLDKLRHALFDSHFPRRLRAIPGLCDSTQATRSSACSMAGK